MILHSLEESFLSCEKDISCINDDNIILGSLIAVSKSWTMFSLQVKSSLLAHSTKRNLGSIENVVDFTIRFSKLHVCCSLRLNILETLDILEQRWSQIIESLIRSRVFFWEDLLGSWKLSTFNFIISWCFPDGEMHSWNGSSCFHQSGILKVG